MHLPLLFPDFPRDATVAFDRRGAVSVTQFLADVAALADALPAKGHVLNDCFDRYHFLVGFAAALLRGQVSLFPANRVAYTWQQLREDYDDVYCLTDQNDAPSVMPIVRYAVERRPENVGAPIPTFPASQPAAVVFTSGSTGRPKPFLKTWGALVLEARAGGARLGLTPGGRGAIVATVPPQHMYGFLTSIMEPLQFGYATCRERPFYPEDIRLALDSSPALDPILVITPTQLRACVLERTNFPPVGFILSSAGPLPSAVAEQAEGLFSTRVREYYGSTETGAIASRRQREGEAWTTFDGVRVRANLGGDGFWVEADYLAEPVLLSDTVEIKSADEFVLLGRSADLVKIGGKRTSLLFLNQQLHEISGVRDGAFVLEEAPDGREPRLTALVVAPTLDREQLLAALRARIDEIFLPRKLYFVSTMPRNATGKLPRDQLLALLREQSAQEDVHASQRR